MRVAERPCIKAERVESARARTKARFGACCQPPAPSPSAQRRWARRSSHLRDPVPGLPTVLLQHPDLLHHHAAVGRLAHVVDGEQTHLNGRQRLHLDPRAPQCLHLRGTDDRVRAFVDFEFDRNAGDRQGMAQRNQVGRSLGGLDGRDTGNPQHIAFFCLAFDDQGQGLWQHTDTTCGTGHPMGDRLAPDVHHVGLPFGVKMGER